MQVASVSLRCFRRCRAALRWKVVPVIPSPLTCGTQGEAQGEHGMTRSWRDTPHRPTSTSWCAATLSNVASGRWSGLGVLPTARATHGHVSQARKGAGVTSHAIRAGIRHLLYQADVLVDHGAASAVVIPQYYIVIFFNIILINIDV
jgi:hypothetical protein